MIQTYTTPQKIRQLIFILAPILITQLGIYSMTFFDIMMAGKYRTTDVAGVSIGSSLWMPVYTGISGILLALTPIISQKLGAKDTKSIPHSVIQALYLGLVMAAVVMFIGSIVLNPILELMNLEQSVHNIAHDYLVALSFGMIPLFLYNVLRSFIDSLGQTRISMFITLLALPINVLFNYLLIYGKWGFPELGGVGSGYATAITYWVIMVIAILTIVKVQPFASYNLFSKLYRVAWKEWRELLMIGLPIGLTIFFETSIFAAVTLFMSNYNTLTIASHQIAMNFASFLYMIPLSISTGLTIVVGFEAGAKRYKDARIYSILGISGAIGLSLLCASVVFFFREQIASIYSVDSDVIQLTAHFLLYATFFQLSDALQAPIQGILRGYKDVTISFFMSFISYWVIGLPMGILLSKYSSLGPFGYWIGLIAGLAIGAVGLFIRLLYVQRSHDPKRIQHQKKTKNLLI